MRTVLFTYLFLLLSLAPLMAQGNGNSEGRFWDLTSIDGEARLRGLYRYKYTTLGDDWDKQQSMYYSGGLRVNTRSYFWHPNFLKLELGGEYFPESNQDEYVVTPDHSEVRTLKALNIGTTLFDARPLTLSTWANWSETYQNRENLTNIRSNTRRLGSALSVRTRILPLNLRYNDIKWNQREIQTERVFQTEQNNFEASTRKSFSDRDKNELSFSHNRYYRNDDMRFEMENINDQIKLNNSIYLDKEKNYVFRSALHNYKRSGSETFHFLNLRESLNLKLPVSLMGRAMYNFYTKDEELQNMKQHKAKASLDHQLFKSLRTGLYYEYAGTKHSRYAEKRNTVGFDLDYSKKIPTGRLDLYYHYSLLKNEMDGDAVDLPVWNEAYQLSDGEMTMLIRPYVSLNSVVVKDVTGTIIYRPNFDYLLIEHGEYLEVQRIPGGQISNGATVYIDYVARQTGSYKYDAHTHSTGARVSLFRRILELYYRGRFLDYRNVEKSDLLVLNYLNQNIFGGLIRIWIFELGAEYESHQSTITPYLLNKYYLNIQKRFGKMVLAVNANQRNYFMLQDSVSRKYSDANIRWSYEVSSRSELALLAGYRKQAGTGIDLDLLTASCEFKTRIRKLYLSAGLDLYRRDYLGDDINYYGGFVQVKRMF